LAERSQCSHCARALDSDTKYCSECGAPQAQMALDLVGVEDPPAGHICRPGKGGPAIAIELDLDGEIVRRVRLPEPFEIRWADGDEFVLETIDGSWRYDISTEVTTRMPGRGVAYSRGLFVMSSCDESLECDVLVDGGSGLEVVDWLTPNELRDGSIDVAPDMSGALLHVVRHGRRDFVYIDLSTGTRVDLGEREIDPALGIVWVEGSRWIVGRDGRAPALLAVDTETGAQIDVELPARSLGSEPFIMAFTPSN
jgi:RNA polymerase subunit RPABC4/transcription elongation factor Spt4